MPLLAGKLGILATFTVILTGYIVQWGTYSAFKSNPEGLAPIDFFVSPRYGPWFVAAYLVVVISFPLFLIAGIVLGLIGWIGGLNSGRKRAVWYGRVATAVNGLFLLLISGADSHAADCPP